jgi:hypothetical protein
MNKQRRVHSTDHLVASVFAVAVGMAWVLSLW